jgi:hypothetical protein
MLARWWWWRLNGIALRRGSILGGLSLPSEEFGTKRTRTCSAEEIGHGSEEVMIVVRPLLVLVILMLHESARHQATADCQRRLGLWVEAAKLPDDASAL